jgi:hypothetical protein
MNNLIVYGIGSTGKYIVNYLLKNLSEESISTPGRRICLLSRSKRNLKIALPKKPVPPVTRTLSNFP